MLADSSVYHRLLSGKPKKFAVLIDPDKSSPDEAASLAALCQKAGTDLILVGGSLITRDVFERCVSAIKSSCDLPVILFPGTIFQLASDADAIFFLSLISGRNPELLIGAHVAAAPLIRQSGIEVISTGYMLIDGGTPTAASYMSNTQPIPANKPEIAAATALAGTMLGLKAIYLDAGSGASNAVNPAMISAVRETVSVPLIIGGGIKTAAMANVAFNAGADIIVMGNQIEKDPMLVYHLGELTNRG